MLTVSGSSLGLSEEVTAVVGRWVAGKTERPPCELRSLAFAQATAISDASAVELLLRMGQCGLCVVVREWKALGADGEWRVLAVRPYWAGPTRLGYIDELNRHVDLGDVRYSVIARFSDQVRIS